MTPEMTRWLSALALLALYLLACSYWLWPQRVRFFWQQILHAADAASADPPIWVVYASQNGFAQRIAEQTAQWLMPRPTRLLPLAQWSPTLGVLPATEQAPTVLFIVSTYGAGEPPDNALSFVTQIMTQRLTALPLNYALLALGDRHYPQFCAFGKRLDQWLQQQGAQRLMPRIELDQADSVSLTRWYQGLQQQLMPINRTASALPQMPLTTESSWQEWRISARHWLNPGSAGLPVFRLQLQPLNPSPTSPQWHAGDLVQIIPPAPEPDLSTSDARAATTTASDNAPRSYSIANLATDGTLELLVRQHAHHSPAGSTFGRVSGWLTQNATQVQLRLVAHHSFRLPAPLGAPLILIANGTGQAGVRAHLAAQAQAMQVQSSAADKARPTPIWLIVGERNVGHDNHYGKDWHAWQQQGVLTHYDAVYSRDTPKTPYVQHVLTAHATRLMQWLDQGAYVVICGSHAMAQSVQQGISQSVGADQMQALAKRIRIDAY